MVSRSRIRRRPVPGAWALLACAALLAARLGRSAPEAPPLDPGQAYRVARVESGETLVLESGERVKLLGVTPLRAARENNWLERTTSGQPLRLEFDRHRLDASGALLAYVFAGDVFVNAEFLRAGLGRIDNDVPLRADRKRALEAAVDASE
jgi:endonuclease YncB( thermonuclease family)